MATTLFQGTPVALAGEFIQKGVQAPDFSLVKGDLSTFSLADAKGKFVVLNIFPSMDTSTFGKDYGVLMTDGPLCGLLARAVVILNPEGKVIYTQLVPEIVKEPDYDAALAALK